MLLSPPPSLSPPAEFLSSSLYADPDDDDDDDVVVVDAAAAVNDTAQGTAQRCPTRSHSSVLLCLLFLSLFVSLRLLTFCLLPGFKEQPIHLVL